MRSSDIVFYVTWSQEDEVAALQQVSGTSWSHADEMRSARARGAQNTLAFLEANNLSQFFVCVATAQTCKHTKPYPDPILWAAAQMDMPPDRCLMIGDTAVDMRAGKAAGTQTVGVLCGFGDEKELREAGADLILPVTTALPEILSSPHLI